jgi:hypothetical protein
MQLVAMAALANAVAALAVVLVIAKRNPKAWWATGLIIVALVLSVVSWTSSARRIARLETGLETSSQQRDTDILYVCRELALSLEMDVVSFRAEREPKSDPTRVMTLVREYRASHHARSSLARLCLPDRGGDRWYACIPDSLTDSTLGEIEASGDIQNRPVRDG